MNEKFSKDSRRDERFKFVSDIGEPFMTKTGEKTINVMIKCARYISTSAHKVAIKSVLFSNHSIAIDYFILKILL